MLYCIKVHRESEDMYVFHKEIEVCPPKTEPTNEEILQLVLDEDLNFDPDYEEFEYFEAKDG